MDLNELLYHHQIALMRADRLFRAPAQAGPRDACLVSHYGTRIARRLSADGAHIAVPLARTVRA